MSDENSEVVFVPIGPVFGWFCVVCGETRMGFMDREASKSSASTHAMDMHAPPGGWEGGHRVLSVEWDDAG